MSSASSAPTIRETRRPSAAAPARRARRTQPDHQRAPPTRLPACSSHPSVAGGGSKGYARAGSQASFVRGKVTAASFPHPVSASWEVEHRQPDRSVAGSAAADDSQNRGVQRLDGGVEVVGLVDGDREGDADPWAVNDGGAPEAVVVPAGLAPNRLAEDPHAEVAGAVGASVAEHRPQGGGLLEHVAVEERAVEAVEIADGGDETAAAVQVEGGIEAGRVGGVEVLVGARPGLCRGGLERLEVGVVEPQPAEAEEGAVGGGEAAAGLPFEDLAEQDVAGVRVVEITARPEERLSACRREPDLLEAGPAGGRVADHGRRVGGVACVVVDAARVLQQVPDVDRAHLVAAAAQQFDRVRAQVLCDRVVERELAVLDESQDRGGRERLRDARDAEAGGGRERLARGAGLEACRAPPRGGRGC